MKALHWVHSHIRILGSPASESLWLLNLYLNSVLSFPPSRTIRESEAPLRKTFCINLYGNHSHFQQEMGRVLKKKEKSESSKTTLEKLDFSTIQSWAFTLSFSLLGTKVWYCWTSQSLLFQNKYLNPKSKLKHHLIFGQAQFFLSIFTVHLFSKLSAHAHGAQLMLLLWSFTLLLGPVSQRCLLSHTKLNIYPKAAPNGTSGACAISWLQ